MRYKDGVYVLISERNNFDTCWAIGTLEEIIKEKKELVKENPKIKEFKIFKLVEVNNDKND